MGHARLSCPSPQIRLPWGGGTRRGTGLSQQPRSWKEAARQEGMGGTPYPFLGTKASTETPSGRRNHPRRTALAGGQALC